MKLRGFGRNEIVMLVVKKRPGILWCEGTHLCHPIKPRAARLAKPAEIKRCQERVGRRP